MKFIHIADLHFGKSFHGYSLIHEEDQKHWKNQFMELVARERPNAVLIAGDVYDRAAPGDEAVKLLDTFLTELAELDVPVLMVSGNHDSGTKLAFGNRLLDSRKIHISGSIADGTIRKVTLEDEHGPVDFWLMPYVFPALVAEVLDDNSIRDYDDAVRRLLAKQTIDPTRRNVLIAHQNVLANGSGPDRGGSETSVGGLGEIDYRTFDAFDYVALGHIHSAQAMGRQTVRYAGSPLCYHFDELKKAKKGPVIVEMDGKGTEPRIRIEQLQPLHPLREITGTLQEILDAEKDNQATNEYIRVVLTDPVVPSDAYARLKAMIESKSGSRFLSYGTCRQNAAGEVSRSVSEAQDLSLDELFADFYQYHSGSIPAENEMSLIRLIADQVGRSDGDVEKDAAQICKLLMEQEEEA